MNKTKKNVCRRGEKPKKENSLWSKLGKPWYEAIFSSGMNEHKIRNQSNEKLLQPWTDMLFSGEQITIFLAATRFSTKTTTINRRDRALLYMNYLFPHLALCFSEWMNEWLLAVSLFIPHSPLVPNRMKVRESEVKWK